MASSGWVGVLLLPLSLAAAAVLTATLEAAIGEQVAGRSAGGAWRIPWQSAIRLLLTQRRVTLAPDALLWRVGGAGILVAAVGASVVVPVGAHAVADLAVGALWWQGIVAALWVLVHMAGYSANSIFTTVGAYRFLAQAMAYEMPMAISVICAALAAHSLRVSTIVQAQHGLWYAVWMPAALVIFLICAAAAAFYGPFSAPLGRDIAGGVAAELSGVDRLLLLAGRHVLLVSAAGFATAVFLGGGSGPLLPAALWSVLKTAGVLAVLVWGRWRWPLMRPERFEEFAWVVLLPVSIAQALLVSLVVLR
jgi:NADH-quinone oxidoreductase subunit H